MTDLTTDIAPEQPVHDSIAIHADDGSVRHTAPLRDGELDGALLSYDDKGQLAQRTDYVNGKRQGNSEIYTDNKLVMRQQFTDDVPNGPTTIYGPAGMLAAELQFVIGLLQGEARYYAQGQLVRIAHYLDGRLHGRVEDYDDNSKLSQTAEYKNDLLHGTLCRYWSNGDLMERSQYVDGQRSGAIERFDSTTTADSNAGPGLMGRMEQLFRGA